MGEVRAVSQSEEPFLDRAEAGRLLGSELEDFSDSNPVVLGIPRSGVIVAREIARRLNAELDIVVSRTLCEPGNPDVTIGAINEEGKLFTVQESREPATLCEESHANAEEEREKQYTMMAESLDRYREIRPKVPLEGRTVIIADDGLTSGAAMQASLWTTRKEKPKRLIAAVPVASMEALDRVAGLADETVVLKTPPIFYELGQFYEFFDRTTDEEILEALQDSVRRKGK